LLKLLLEQKCTFLLHPINFVIFGQLKVFTYAVNAYSVFLWLLTITQDLRDCQPYFGAIASVLKQYSDNKFKILASYMSLVRKLKLASLESFFKCILN